MKFGLTGNEFDFIVREIVQPLNEFGLKVYCFGSRARGDHQKFSDLDLLVEIKEDFAFEKVSSKIGQITETLVESNFPYKVDLVLSNRLASSYLENIDREKVVFLNS